MEIKVGEYVRTNKGNITKMSSEEFIKIMLENKSIFGKALKHSKNIIDLVEVGDYVNGHLVINIEKDENNKQKIITENKYFDKYYENGIAKIESIVTKEQFESIEYKVEE